MRILPLPRGALLCFFVSLALAASLSYADQDNVGEVVGQTECADCAQNNFDTRQAFTGLHVTIDCKAKDGHFKTRGKADIDEHGHFKVSLPKENIINEECYAQLHSASSTPCPAHESLESSKIVLPQTETTHNSKNTFGLPGNLKFSPITCSSKFFWHHFHNHPFFHHPSPPKEETPVPPPKKETPCPPKKEKPVELPPPTPKKEKPCPPKKEKPPPKKEEPAPKKEKPGPKKKPCPPKKEEPAPKKEKPAPKKEPYPPKKEEPKTPVVKPNPPETPTYKHPFFKHPFIKNHPFFKHLPPHPFFPPHHP